MASLRGATDARQMNWSGHRRMSSTLNFTVKSTGGNNDDVPEFYVDGGKLPVSTGGGVNVAVVEQDGELKTFKVFDTHADGSEALVSFLNDLSMGSIVLLAVRDDAQSLQSNMSQAATAAIESCGADKIKNLVYRGAYALIGIKGGQALAEETGKGYVVAVAQREVAISVEVDKPVCAARVPEPPVTGNVSNGNLMLDAGCRYALWEKDNTAQCLQGTWVIITGASNALLEFGNLINHMAPDEYHIEREGEMIGASALIDVIIEDGKVAYWAVVDNGLPVCRQIDKAIAAQNDAACREAIREHLAKAPPFAGSGTRITMFVSFFWDRTSVALDAVSADPGWAGAEVSLVTQVGAWYSMCSITKADYCPRKELLVMDIDPAVQVFRDEMEEVFSKMDVFCSSSGRAGKRGCNVQTISWTNSQRDKENFRQMNHYIKEAMETRKSKNFRLIDFFNLGAAMPEEIVQGHGSQMLNLWVWQVMLGTMCPADEAADRSDAQFEGNLCSGTEAKFENCPEYYPACKNGPRCEIWECMHSVPCTLKAVQGEVAGNTGMCEDPVRLTSFLQASEHDKSTQSASAFDECHNATGFACAGIRVRLWLQNGIQRLRSTLAGLGLLPNPDSSLSEIPAFLKLDEDMIDTRLELDDPDGETLGADVINPSLLIQGDRVVVVARRHRQETLQYTGTFNGPEGSRRATIIDQVWHSDIILGNIDVDAQAWANWPAGGANPLHGLSMQTWSGLRTPEGGPWHDLCTKETWHAANNTLIRHVVTGPEDPKAVSQNGSLVIVFDSLPPSGGGEECRRNQRGFSDAVTQMYISSGVKVSEPSAKATGFRLTYGLGDENEKNWVPFATAESLYFAYAPMPHVIVTAQPDGSSSKVFSTSFRPLQRIVQENPSIRIRGSAQAVFVDDPSATPNLPYPHHLALLHLYDMSSKRYAHFAYRFSAQAPFSMLQMSDQLPLTEAEAKPGGIPFAFASGLMLQNRTVAVTYGAGDRDARALVLTLERLDKLFECSAYADA
eukprot:TRINITY_DN2405_c0_g1_i1.p1 TRINITY_DN2405_c0_g1~~TRINITY_DN2405_c0_g1_i1.p1  ORF type:complete len:1055 (+),score=183.52 TRINITY_DN2405_c0_g1_i1:126-3167(+)